MLGGGGGRSGARGSGAYVCCVSRAQLEKLQFTYTFIRDVAVPLRLDPTLTLETLDALRGESLRK